MLTYVMITEGHFNTIRLQVTYIHEVVYLFGHITGCKFCMHNN